MKKVLVTGASGSIGINVIKYLLSEGKYEITALDLKNNGSIKRLKKYRRRINIVFGDTTDSVLIDALIKEHDYVIHLAGVMPPLADLKKDLANIVDYKGTENIIRSINYFNPKCFLIYPSTTTVYGNKKDVVTTKSRVASDFLNYYTNTKLDIEKLIKKKIENYVIFRLPIVLANPREQFIYNGIMSNKIEVITNMDAAYALVSSIKHSKTLRGKVYNLGGGENCITTYRELIINILKIYGVSFKFLLTRLFVDKNYYGHIYADSNEAEDILHFRNDSIASFYMRLKRQTKKRAINRMFAKPIIWCLKNSKSKER